MDKQTQPEQAALKAGYRYWLHKLVDEIDDIEKLRSIYTFALVKTEKKAAPNNPAKGKSAATKASLFYHDFSPAATAERQK